MQSNLRNLWKALKAAYNPILIEAELLLIILDLNSFFNTVEILIIQPSG